jgi:predicted HicB family RNase H-like nuclease
MNDLLEYKDYHGSVSFSSDDSVFHGKIEFINDLITFEADNVPDLKESFSEAVDDYLETCKALGREPQKPYKGTFNVRIRPELHKKAVLAASKKKISLNKLVENAISHEIDAI